MFNRFPPETCHKCGGKIETTRSDLFERRWQCVGCTQGYALNAVSSNTHLIPGMRFGNG